MTTQEQKNEHGSDPKGSLGATRFQPGRRNGPDDTAARTSTQPKAQRMARSAAILAAVLLGGIAILQVALAAGARWGGIAWGGVEEGQLSDPLRVASAVAAIVLAWMALVLLTRGGVMPKTKIVPARHLRVETWAIAVVMGLNTLGNLASGNPFEQTVFAPATAVLTALAVYLAVRGVETRS